MAEPKSTEQGASTADWTPMETAAIQLHEVFVSYVKAGFSEEQALALVTAAITGGRRG